MYVIRLGQGSNCTQCPPSTYNFLNIVIYVFMISLNKTRRRENRIQNSEFRKEFRTQDHVQEFIWRNLLTAPKTI